MKISDRYFRILGVTKYDSKESIKKAYRDLIKLWHPDKFPGDTRKQHEASEKCKLINEAYSVLKDYNPPKVEEKPLKENADLRPTQTKFNNDNQNTNKRFNSDAQNSNKRFYNIQRIRVQSSNISSIGYDPTLKVLQVAFYNGSIYQYYNVPLETYDLLMMSSSKAVYFNKYISKRYKFEAVR